MYKQNFRPIAGGLSKLKKKNLRVCIHVKNRFATGQSYPNQKYQLVSSKRLLSLREINEAGRD